MKTTNDISVRRGKASISSLNRIKKVVKWIAISIASIIALTLWMFIKPIVKGIGWVISLMTSAVIIYWILTL